MNEPSPSDGYADAQRFRLHLNLRQSYAERLRTLAAMIEFTERAQVANPKLQWVVEQLRQRPR
jgi:hypothetical protein